jgi:hypothetical protein
MEDALQPHGSIPSVFISRKREFQDFFQESYAKRTYAKFGKQDENPEMYSKSKAVFEFLQARVDRLMSSIINHRKPALQGVIYELELMLRDEFQWTVEDKLDRRQDVRHFITMIGAMVKYLVSEFGYEVDKNRQSYKLHCPEVDETLISTSSCYKLSGGGKNSLKSH